MASTAAHILSDSQGCYPVVASDDGWVARIGHYEPRCKSCDPAVSERVLHWLVMRARLEPYKGERVTVDRMHRWMEEEHNVSVRIEGFKDHLKKHVVVEQVASRNRRPAGATRFESDQTGAGILVKRAKQERALLDQAGVERLREAAQVRTAEPVQGGTPDHIGYLQTVVGIAEAVVREFPERVTPEMGLRAASELARIKASAERDRMLEVLAFASGQRARRELPVVEVVMSEASA